MSNHWYICRIRLNSSGYSSEGYYYGSGPTLYYAHTADDKLDFYLRGTRDYIKAAIDWVKRCSDPEQACRHLNSTGQIGT